MRICVWSSDVSSSDLSYARGRALAFDLDRHQDEWRTVAARFMLRLLPLQHAERQEERVGSALLEIRLGLAVEFHETRIELLLIALGPQQTGRASVWERVVQYV